MAESKDQKFMLLPEWAIRQANESLFISGGADAKYEIVLEKNEASFFSSKKATKPFTRNDLSLKDQRVLEELVTAEIVVPVLQKNKNLKLAVVGDTNQLALPAQKNIQTADIVIVVRTNSTFAELLGNIKYVSLTKPHLFIDMAYHHTLSLGPLVFPGETACIACLQGRISTRWGDEAPPSQPKLLHKYTELVTELLKIELDRIANDDTSLTNKTYSWNFQDRAIKKDQLLKVPICPVCAQNKIDQVGPLALPWSER